MAREPASGGQAGPTPLVRLVEYQDDAIVSKVLAKAGGSNVTLFAFGAGQELSEHTVAFDAVIHVFDGTAEIGVGAEHHRVNEGEIIRLPAATPHWVKAERPFKMMLIILRDQTAKTSA